MLNDLFNYTLSICDSVNCSGFYNTSFCRRSYYYGVSSLGRVVSIVGNKWGNGLVILTSSNNKSAEINIWCDVALNQSITLDSVNQTHNSTRFLVYGRSRYACPTNKPNNHTSASLCGKISYNSGCYREECCYSKCIGNYCNCYTSFGQFNATLIETAAIFGISTPTCGFPIQSAFVLSGANDHYSGSTFFVQGSTRFYSSANITTYHNRN